MIEQTHVHDVYERIAPHFSSTRYKPWAQVEKYILEQTPGSIGVDIGCGNGKYLRYPHVYIIGNDRSAELCNIAADRTKLTKNDVFRCDGLAVPTRPVDFAISIAVVHHFSTRDRRQLAVKHILEKIRPGGTALIYVWALEQASSRRGYSEGMNQDVMVPWVDNKNPDIKYERFYHLYKQGELEFDVETVGGKVVSSGYERDNWWVIASA